MNFINNKKYSNFLTEIPQEKFFNEESFLMKKKSSEFGESV